MQEYWWSFEEVQRSQGQKGAEPVSEELRRSTLGPRKPAVDRLPQTTLGLVISLQPRDIGQRQVCDPGISRSFECPSRCLEIAEGEGALAGPQRPAR